MVPWKPRKLNEISKSNQEIPEVIINYLKKVTKKL